MRIRKIKWIAASLTLLAMTMPNIAQAAPLKVVASFSIVGDMVHEVGGDAIALTTLVGPDGDAHTYEPTPADAKALSHADLVIVNGLGLEGWIGKLVVASGYSGQVVAAIKDITPLSFSGDGLSQDPHAWQDVSNAKRYVATIRDALIAADKAHADAYQKNAARYLAQLDELDAWVKSEIARVPQAKRKVISSHDAFQYFGKAYGITFIAPLGISTEGEASAGAIAKLIDQIRREHIHALFFENMTDKRMIEQLKTDSDATIGGTLYSDALSPPDGPAATYIAMFHHNVEELTKGMMQNQ